MNTATTLFEQDFIIHTKSPINVDKLSLQNKALAKYLLAGNSINMTESGKLKMLCIGVLHSRIADVRKFFKDYDIEIEGPRITVNDVTCCNYKIKK